MQPAKSFLIPCFALSLAALVPAQGRIVGYYPEWAVYGRNYHVRQIPASKLDVINYGFARIDPQALTVRVDDAWAAIQQPLPGNDPTLPFQGNYNALVQLKRQAPHLKTMISIGGWTLSAPFSDAALTATSRATFSASAVSFMRQYQFDGLDIDWEYPVSGGLQNGRPEDRVNYTLLLRRLRADLDAQGGLDGRRYLLTIAAPASPQIIANVEMTAVAGACDWINLMTYDMHGSWEMVTDHNAPLYGRYGSGSNQDPMCAHNAVDAYVQGGVPSEKLVLGLALYGRGWSGVPAGGSNGLRQTATGIPMGTWEPGIFDYSDLQQRLASQPGVWTRSFDNVAKVPFLYAPSVAGGTWITYEDTQSVLAKAAYIQQRRLGGAMFWELSADGTASGTPSLLTTIETALKPVVPLRVDSLHLSEAMGSTATFRLSDAPDARSYYVLLGGVSGTAPGFDFGSVHVPLNLDFFSTLVLSNLNTPLFSGFFGVLDMNGDATAKITVPAIPGAAGLDFHFVYVNGFSWDSVSNPVALRVVR